MNTSRTSEQIISRSPEETRALAARVLAALPERAVIALHGELGSGKTCFVQGLALVLGIGQPVTSPTFTMINEYRGERPLYHVDLYRVRNPDEAVDLGLDEYLPADGITVIEWAERAGDLIPPDAAHVYFRTLKDPDEREIRIDSPAGGG
jgi:tRNA threonylcarbamoyladenosine biosynthesis protein TsaE